ncbi:hypothetical protein GOP47_0022498 [Adiantum capillus-veneris]|uniref:SHSP domain-containing protein n=2 Tax=Adiantum capillus-veneris TaxID=13818 RepID=A0A9D4Z5E2_ADICA|nr:hypothetical protein GOP47_0022498 [Adiantum capillus-veneris]
MAQQALHQTGKNTLHVIQEEIFEAFVFSVILPDGARVEDMQVQVEEETTLIVSLQGYNRQRFELSPKAHPDGINASFKDGTLTITIPKKA